MVGEEEGFRGDFVEYLGAAAGEDGEEEPAGAF